MNPNRLAKCFHFLALAFIITSLLTAPMSISAQTAAMPDGVKKVTSVEGITEY